MISVKECKALARENLQGRYGTVIGAYVVSGLIEAGVFIAAFASLAAAMYCGGVFGGVRADFGMTAAFSAVFTALLLFAVILSLFFSYGQTKLLLNMLRGKKYGITDIFAGFRSGSNVWTFIFTGIIKSLLILVFTLITNICIYFHEYRIMSAGLNAGRAGIVYPCIRILIFAASVYVVCTLFLSTIIAADRTGAGVSGALRQSAALMKNKKTGAFWFTYFSFIPWELIAVMCPFAALWINPYVISSEIIFYMAAEETLWQLPGSAKDEIKKKQNAFENDIHKDDIDKDNNYKDNICKGNTCENIYNADASASDSEMTAELEDNNENTKENKHTIKKGEGI